mgnify:FL=1
MPAGYSDIPRNRLDGDQGNSIDGGAGNDFIAAGTGADYVHGGEDKDFIYGMDQGDVLFGDGDNDINSVRHIDRSWLDKYPADIDFNIRSHVGDHFPERDFISCASANDAWRLAA